jgi:hypothetical protein
LLDDALRLREVFVDGQPRAATNRDEPLRADDPYRRAQRSAGAAVGAVAGLMLGFIGGFLIFVGLMQSRGPDAGIGMFFLMPLLAFGGAAVMVIVGALTGRRFSRFIPLPKAADGSHLKATAWRGFGTFVGFAVGGFIGMQIDRLVGGWIWPEELSPPWFDLPVLFGCVLAGAFGGWRVGCLIEVRRAKSRPAAPSSTDGPATSEA